MPRKRKALTRKSKKNPQKGFDRADIVRDGREDDYTVWRIHALVTHMDETIVLPAVEHIAGKTFPNYSICEENYNAREMAIWPSPREYR